MECRETPYLRPKGYASHYRDRRFRTGSGAGTHAREVSVLQRLLAEAGPTGTWLDIPSGAGRLTGLLPAGAVQVDRNLEMVGACGDGHPRLCASVHALPFGDRSFDGVLCMRLLHHIPTSAERVTILQELARVSRGPVVFSFFHATSLQHLRRLLSGWAGRRRSSRCAITARTMRQDVSKAGLTVAREMPLRRYWSEQWLVSARRAT